MRIGLNGTCFNDRPSGANQRFAGIYGALIARRPDIEFVVFEPADCRVGSWFAGAPNVTVRRTPLPSTGRMRRALHGLRYWRAALAREKLDIFEAFHLPVPHVPHCPTLLTIHDARPVLRDVPLVKRTLHRHVLRSGLRKAEHVITVSRTMREEILGIEPAAIVTSVYNGINPAEISSVTAAQAEATRSKLGLPTEFMLAVGHLEARKNYLNLIEAVACLRDEGRMLPLVIVGNDGGEEAAIRQRIAEKGLELHVRLLRGVSNSDLNGVYASSKLVVFPSTYEGFGIPILEAMAAHRPLLLSDIPVFRELTEGKGAYFEPYDSLAIARAIRSLVESPERQRELIAYGAERLRAFSFDALAMEIEEIYERLVGPASAPQGRADAVDRKGAFPYLRATS